MNNNNCPNNIVSTYKFSSIIFINTLNNHLINAIITKYEESKTNSTPNYDLTKNILVFKGTLKEYNNTNTQTIYYIPISLFLKVLNVNINRTDTIFSVHTIQYNPLAEDDKFITYNVESKSLSYISSYISSYSPASLLIWNSVLHKYLPNYLVDSLKHGYNTNNSASIKKYINLFNFNLDNVSSTPNILCHSAICSDIPDIQSVCLTEPFPGSTSCQTLQYYATACDSSGCNTPTPSPSPPTPHSKTGLFLGGWNNCNQNTWHSSWGCNTILIGPFGGHPADIDDDNLKGYDNVIWTIGGAGVAGKLSELVSDITSHQSKYKGKINGVCFDCEMGGSPKTPEVYSWMKSNKSSLTKIGMKYFILCPDNLNMIGDDGTFTHMSPMSYNGNATSYPQYDTSDPSLSNPGVAQWVRTITCTDGNGSCDPVSKPWTADKIIIAFQSVAMAYGASCQNDGPFPACEKVWEGRERFAKWMGSLMKPGSSFTFTYKGGASWPPKPHTIKGPLAGIFGWCAQAQTPQNAPPNCLSNIDKDNWDLIKKYM